MDEVALPKFLSVSLKFDKTAKLDGNKFIFSGHSLGGCTALKVGDSDPRVKAVLTLDPWLCPIKDWVEEKKLTKLYKKPTFMLNS